MSGVLPHAHLAAFLITVYVLIVIPGPSVVFTVSRGVALGRRAALATVLGNTSGLMLQLLIVVIGLGSVLAHSETVFLVMKLLGGGYLIFLGLRSIRSRRELVKLLAPGAVTPKQMRTIIREGFVVGATNPKGLVIFTAVLPTFVDRSQGHAALQLATLGVVCGVVALLSDGAWAVASGTARAWLGRSPRRLEWMSASGGVTMIALGAGLAITGAAADRTRHTPPARDRDADSASLADGPESSALRRPAPRAAVVPWQPRGRRSSSVAIPRL